jgi:predicted O-linked N-acetylglucosamine transferase (SPINDLY family)
MVSFDRRLSTMATLAEALQIALEYLRAGKVDLAQEIYRRIRAADPLYADTLANVGRTLRDQGRAAEAIVAYGQALQLRPDFVEALNGLGIVLCELGKLNEAAAAFRRAVELRPDFADAYGNLGNVLEDLGRLDEAVACHRRALELKPDCAEAYNNLGLALRTQGKPDDAAAQLRRAVELKPDYAEAYNNLALALQDQGSLDEAVACLRRGLELNPDNARTHSNLVSTLHYCPDFDLQAIGEEHRCWDRQHAQPLAQHGRPHLNDRTPDRRLRLGFVSSDFGRHPVGFFLIRALESLDRTQCEVVCYSDRLGADEFTARFKSTADRWLDVCDRSDEQLAELIRGERVDILFDLAGHTARNRLLCFARKPAPVQVTWIGYEGTTGLTAIDYSLADRHVAPPEIEAHASERVLRLPDGYVCYDPPGAAPPVGPLPALATGQVTLASFNSPTKITPQVVAVWSQILGRVPGSRLMLKYLGLDRPQVRARFERMFAAQGIGAERLQFAGQSPYAEYLAAYHQVDLALDPFPFNGGATTCEALWMGVPVVTWPGTTFASRHSLSHLSAVGLTETVARSLPEYVDLAVGLARDLPRLVELRVGLRSRMARSPLCDGKRFAENLLRVLRDVWREWCRQPLPDATGSCDHRGIVG